MEKNLILKELKKLAVKYRKDWGDHQIVEMAETTADSLKFVPVDRIPEVFTEAFRTNRYFPDDRQLLVAWVKIKNKGNFGDRAFDCWGNPFIKGTFYHYGNRPLPEWLVSGDITDLIKYKSGKMSDHEIFQFKENKYPPVQGQIQKPRHEWNQDDNAFQQQFNEDYESLRTKYIPLLGIKYIPYSKDMSLKTEIGGLFQIPGGK